MNKLFLVFEYVHYRIYQYSKERGHDTPELNAILVLTLVQFFFILDLITISLLFTDYTLPSKYAFLPFLAIFGVINWYKFGRTFNSIDAEKKWITENQGSRLKKGQLIATFIIIILLLPVLYGILKHNLKLI